MLSALCLILVLIYLYRNHLYNKLDRNKLSHSSYYDVTYGGERKCSGDVLRILRDVGGYKKLLVNWRYLENGEAFAADIIMIHETGIYVVEAKDYQGWISGNPEEEYWVQTLCASQLTSYKNYFYNPLLKNEACIARLQKELPDMKWLPYFSLAVFGNSCELENAGLSDNTSKIILARQLSYTIYGMVRSARKFLAPQVIDEIYDRLSVSTKVKSSGGRYSSIQAVSKWEQR